MTPVRRALWGLFNLNAASVWLFFREGKTPAADYLSTTVRLYRGYGVVPFHWDRSSWRRDFLIPSVPPAEVFPEADFVRAPELLFPYPRYLSIKTHELIFLCQLVRSLQPKTMLEFGTAEGRTAINLALHAPEGTQVVTVNAPLKPPETNVGMFYHGHPLEAKIKEVLVDLKTHDWSPYADSMDFVFCDALDDYEGVGIETGIAFSMVRLGGTVVWHDYGSGEGRTQYLNDLYKQFPLVNIRDTCMVCLRVNTPELLAKAREVSAHKGRLNPRAWAGNGR